jgi:hypothetical protein
MKNFKIIVLGIAIVLICGMLFTACGEKEEDIVCYHYDYDYDESNTATCSQDGYVICTCTNCGYTYQYEVYSTGHKYDDYGICTSCFEFCAEIGYISDRSVEYNEKKQEYYFYFSLKDANYRKLCVDATVDIRIENDQDEVVYSAQKKVTPDDYNSNLNAVVVIPASKIKDGLSDRGTFYYEVTTDTADFDEFELSIRNLPKKDWAKECHLEIPETPAFITYIRYSSDPLRTEVTDIEFEFTTQSVLNKTVSLEVTIKGQRVDYSTSTSNTCCIGYKLLDSEGYVVESGTFYTPAIAPGEKFKDISKNFYALEPGEYTLVLLDVS